ncbi:MAG: hypothetical protein EA400_04965 [Chromatiaceae bacterium]|nr:MAG: hypothetical protein EA400_04965 [Chromatiaceae bacterium]
MIRSIHRWHYGRFAALLVVFLLVVRPALAQDAPAAPPAVVAVPTMPEASVAPEALEAAATGALARPAALPPGAPLDPATLQSLEALERALESRERQVERVQRRLIEAQDDVTRQDLADRLRAMRAELEEQRQQFDRFALAIDLRPFIDDAGEQPFDWQREISKLLRPILAELENATAESRAIGDLRAQMNGFGERKDLAEQAVSRLQRLLAQDPSPSLRMRLEERLEHWQRVASESADRYTALDLQLQNRLQQRQSVLDETTSFARDFFRNRGLNLFLAVSAFVAVFLGIRWLSSALLRLRKPEAGKQFSSRLAVLLLHVFSILGGLLAMMLVFNAAGDWFMLGIIIIFLIGIGWASINTLPSQIETVKLVLNVGTVREGERVEFNGLPYRVESLAFQARLVNPELDGGVQVLPVRDLVGYHSRPAGAEEVWFPTRTGDWVELGDGRLGRIAHQSPSAVHLIEPGGAEVIYPAAGFIAQHPRRLAEQFRIVARFCIDYKHQAIATSEVPKLMQAQLQESLPEVVGAEAIRVVTVLFAAATASALEYRIHVDLDAAAAPQIEIIRHAVQRILVEACNRYGWVIPFTQITVHQAQA